MFVLKLQMLKYGNSIYFMHDILVPYNGKNWRRIKVGGLGVVSTLPKLNPSKSLCVMLNTMTAYSSGYIVYVV